MKTKAEPKNDIEARTHRFNLELSTSVLARLDELVSRTGSASRAESLRRAIGYYGLLVEEALRGNQLEIVAKDGNRRVITVIEAV